MDRTNLPVAGLQQRLDLLERIACSLEEAQLAIAGNDLTALEHATSNQAQLCAEWRTLESGGAAVSAMPGDPGRAAYLRIEQQTRQIEARLRHLVRVHAALLRGAQASLGVMANLLLRGDGTYGAPDWSPRSPGGCKETMPCRL